MARLEGGRLNILTIGEKRFELVDVVSSTPFMIGNIRFLREKQGEISEHLLIEIREEYETFLKQLATVAGGWNRTLNVPSDSSTLARDVIATMASSIELSTGLRQEVLEDPQVTSRLERLLPLLKQDHNLIHEKPEDSNPFKGARLN
jgi:ATP-dependent Lon protease